MGKTISKLYKQRNDMIYTLRGHTKKGKQRIQQHGAEWYVVEKRQGTFGDTLLRSIKTQDLRWLTDDFIVEKMQ
jgi:hypothetical protein